MTDLPPSATRKTVVAASVRWNVPPIGALASRVRELLGTICDALLEPDELHSVAMAAHELLENLLKYSADGACTFDVEICDDHGRQYVRLRTINRSLPEHIDDVERLLRRLADAANPMVVYDALVANSPQRKGSGLGLARICAEGAMKVECSMENTVLTITAERPVALREIAK